MPDTLAASPIIEQTADDLSELQRLILAANVLGLTDLTVATVVVDDPILGEPVRRYRLRITPRVDDRSDMASVMEGLYR